MGDKTENAGKGSNGVDQTAGAVKEGQADERARETEGLNEFVGEFGFSTFILSLSTSALVYLGELPDLTTNAMEVNLPLAKQTITVIEMLKEKTKGNLIREEETLVDQVLYDLRVKYVKASKR